MSDVEDMRKQTIDTYNQSASALAEYFRGIGPRVKYIDLAFRLAGKPERARVLEIGCGDGRDAKEIVKRADWYLGFDVSEELIKLAREHVPEATFEVADAATFEYPENLNVVFAFASILHLNREEIQNMFQKLYTAMRPGGVFYISSKESPEYKEEIKDDQFGKRLFYFYNSKIIAELAGEGFKVVEDSQETIGHTNWFEMALQKI